MAGCSEGRWGITFLIGSSRLSQCDKYYLMHQATEMYKENEVKRHLKADGLEGVLVAGGYELLGTFGGQRFDAEIDYEGGTEKLRFLVHERTGMTTCSPGKKQYLH